MQLLKMKSSFSNYFKRLNLISLLFLFCTFSLSAQVLMGGDIDGEAGDDEAGYSISMPNATTIAIGAPKNDGNGVSAGHVRIYELIGNTWQQKGGDIDGKAAYDESGFSVSMPDPFTVAIGSPYYDGIGTNSGQVRVFRLSTGNNWVQKGSDINGEWGDDKSGWSVSMPDANTIAIGAPDNDGPVILSSRGHVRVYRWTGAAWVQKGADMDAESSFDGAGTSVSMPDANTVAFGAPGNSGSALFSGHVRVFAWNGTAWQQKGNDIDGENTRDQSGQSVSMPDANTIAIGAPFNRFNNFNGVDAGHARVYAWNGNAWVQKGTDLDGEGRDDQSGKSVWMPNANTIAIGARLNDPNGSNTADAGHVRVYQWNGSSWVQRGTDIDGENWYDESGAAVCMPDNTTIAIGAPGNNGTGGASFDCGHTRVYTYSSVGEDEIDAAAETGFSIYPNPATEHLTIQIAASLQEKAILRIQDLTGRIVYEEVVRSKNITLQLGHLNAGVYFIAIEGQQQKFIIAN